MMGQRVGNNAPCSDDYIGRMVGRGANAWTSGGQGKPIRDPDTK
ncbi:hypothetical protein SAMN04244553_4814 [Nocardia amikacinitolerans]|uniref:Uncharacterized protein n=1 Tax=Nocardia amikacinitolerans TaxID=756689 RepID=A0A285LSJ0_9NOCA|nr:hypothetical protein SAMN04244553_4814 [Nocardia amikacinitolerans]